MAMANVPNEETPLLGGQQSSAAGGVTSPESEVATLAGSRTPSVKDRSNTDGGPDVIKKTPLPWAQLSIVLFLEIAEPLTAQVISPVSSSTGFRYHFLLWRRLTSDGGIQLTADRPFSIVRTRGQFGKLRKGIG